MILLDNNFACSQIASNKGCQSEEVTIAFARFEEVIRAIWQVFSVRLYSRENRASWDVLTFSDQRLGELQVRLAHPPYAKGAKCWVLEISFIFY